MIVEDIKSIKSGKKELRQFGLTIGIVLGLLGLLFWWLGENYYPYLLILSAAFLLFGLILPITLKPIQKIWMSLAVVLGWLMTRIILIILFYLIFTPIGILGRMFGKSFLDLKFSRIRNVDSYWIPKGKVGLDRSYYEKQF